VIAVIVVVALVIVLSSAWGAWRLGLLEDWGMKPPAGTQKLQFTILNTPPAFTARRATLARPMAAGTTKTTAAKTPLAGNEFRVEAKRVNPDGWCLRTGKQVRDCSCELHRGVH